MINIVIKKSNSFTKVFKENNHELVDITNVQTDNETLKRYYENDASIHRKGKYKVVKIT